MHTNSQFIAHAANKVREKFQFPYAPFLCQVATKKFWDNGTELAQ